MGSPSYLTVDAGDFRVTEALFPAGAVLDPHQHERTIVAVMLDGTFDLTFPSHAFRCEPGTLFVEPGGERHANRVERAGARVMVLEIASACQRDDLSSCAQLLGQPSAERHAGALGLARQLRRELRMRDTVSPLALEALGLELLVAATRTEQHRLVRKKPPRWLGQVRELLHASVDRPLRLADIAREVGVHRVHLGRVFRSHFGESLGSYHRRLRIDWAAEQMKDAAESMASIALRAGFADQSHFTRMFRRYHRVTPAHYRREHTGQPD